MQFHLLSTAFLLAITSDLAFGEGDTSYHGEGGTIIYEELDTSIHGEGGTRIYQEEDTGIYEKVDTSIHGEGGTSIYEEEDTSINSISINSTSIRDDLASLNVTCPESNMDNCQNSRNTDSLNHVSCQCTAICAQLNTCCFDSPYRSVKPAEISSSCRPISDRERYFMVERCPPNSVLEDSCKAEWNGDGDVMGIVPVTSRFTLMTYKNYFCFRCNEKTDDFVYWNVELGRNGYDFDPSINTSSVSVRYFSQYRTWVAPVGTGGSIIPVRFSILIPKEISPLPEPCDVDMISRCADTWEDKDVAAKCEAYMGRVTVTKNDTILTYRNAHCALCNYEDSSTMSCRIKYSGWGAKMPFSFTHLLDVNRSDGDKVGKIEKCEGDTLWDPYAKKCRELKCALPGHVVKEGKCTPP